MGEPEHEMMTLGEVATLLRLHPQTVRTLALSGELPGVKVGQQWRFRRAAVLALLPAPAAPK